MLIAIISIFMLYTALLVNGMIKTLSLRRVSTSHEAFQKKKLNVRRYYRFLGIISVLMIVLIIFLMNI